MTLIEIMVVVLIISVLVGIATLIYGGIEAESRQKVCRANLRTIDGSIAQYRADFGTVPADLDTLITSNFLSAQPNDPHAGYTTYAVVNGEARSGDDHQTY